MHKFKNTCQKHHFKHIDKKNENYNFILVYRGQFMKYSVDEITSSGTPYDYGIKQKTQ